MMCQIMGNVMKPAFTPQLLWSMTITPDYGISVMSISNFTSSIFNLKVYRQHKTMTYNAKYLLQNDLKAKKYKEYHFIILEIYLILADRWIDVKIT